MVSNNTIRLGVTNFIRCQITNSSENVMEDSPGVAFTWSTTANCWIALQLSLTSRFETTLEFQPIGGHWVPLRKVDWSWGGDAVRNPINCTGTSNDWIGTNPSTSSPVISDTQEYPKWVKRLTEEELNNPPPMFMSSMFKKLRSLTGIAATGLICTAISIKAQLPHWTANAIAQGHAPFTLPALPYAVETLEPVFSPDMLKEHRTNHSHYVVNLNKTLSQDLDFYGQWALTVPTEQRTGAKDRWLELMLRDLNSVPGKIRSPVETNGGGHYNHSLYWQTMKPKGGGEPKGVLAAAIKQEFGSFSRFKQAFTKAALAHTGEGWTWLSLDGGKLKIETLPGEGSPLTGGRPVLLGLDLWDHAYRPQYARRADYVAAWFNVVNWDFVAERYAKLTAEERSKKP
jgi:Fe-Mn family superoxide dismutase